MVASGSKIYLGQKCLVCLWVMLEVSLEIGAFAKLRTDLGLAGSPKKIWGKKIDG